MKTKPQERPGPALQGAGGRLPRRLPRRARRRRTKRAQAGDRLGRRAEDPAGRPLHRGLPGGREEGRTRGSDAERLLAGLRRPGEVQGARARPDRPGRRTSIFQVAGQCGLGALDAAKEKNVWGIGVDADQAYLGEHVLTSALKKVDVAVFETIQDVVRTAASTGGDEHASSTSPRAASASARSAPTVPRTTVAEVKRVQDADRGRRRSRTSPDDRRPGAVVAGQAAPAPAPVRIAADGRAARPRAPRDHEAVPRHRRERPRRLRPAPGRGARAARRERRRQVDADERPLRALPARRGRDPDQRQAGRARLAEGRDRARRSAWCTSTSC